MGDLFLFCYSKRNRGGSTEGEDLASTRKFVPGEVCRSLAETPRKKAQPFHPALGQRSCSQQLHSSGDSSASQSCGVSMAAGTSCTLPRVVRVAAEVLIRC